MPTSNDTTKRRKTRYRGISYRERRDGTRTYSIYWHGNYVAVEGGEQEALIKQGQLRDGAARGEAPAAQTKVTFGVVAERWIASKHRLRPYTRLNYRATLDRILIPRFGTKKIGTITKADIVGLICDLEKQGLAATTITDYMKPLYGTLRYAVEEGLITANPCSRLSRDDRPRAQGNKADHVWSDEEMAALIEAAEYLARRPEVRADYTRPSSEWHSPPAYGSGNFSGCSGVTSICPQASFTSVGSGLGSGSTRSRRRKPRYAGCHSRPTS